MPLDRTHQHISSDVMQVDAVHTPISTGGATQTVTLLGPFRVNWDDQGPPTTGADPVNLVDGGYVSLADVPDGAVVIVAWAERVSPFDDGHARITPVIQPIADPDNENDLSDGWRVDPAASIDKIAYVRALLYSTGAPILGMSRAVSGAELACYYLGDAPSTEGSADIYALIATPS